MAGNKNDLGNLSLDSLDLPDMDFDISEPKDNRKPITKIATSFASAAKDQLTSSSFVRNVVTKALPSGYGRALNALFDTRDNAKKLYNSAANELRPAIPDMKRAVQKIMPTLGKVLPDSLVKKLDDAVKDDQYAQQTATTPEMENEDRIAETMADIFRADVEFTANRHAQTMATAMVRGRIQDDQFDASYKTMRGIGMGISRLVSYQDEVTAKYQRKVLELGYRQLFTMRQQLKLSTAVSKDTLQYLNAIMLNTTIPETVKQKEYDKNKSLKDKLIDGIIPGGRDALSKYTAQLTDNLIATAKNHLGRGVGALRNGMSMSGAVQGMDGYTTGGSLAGGVAGMGTRNIFESMAQRYGAKLAKRFPKLVKGSARMNYEMDNIPEAIQNLVMNGTNHSNGLVRGLSTFMRGQLPKLGANNRIGDSPFAGLQEPVSFNAAARRSLTEVIPGFLGRIHQELVIMRTGNPNAERLTFDMKKGEFMTVRASAEKMFADVFQRGSEKDDKGIVGLAGKGKLGLDDTQGAIGELVDTIDKDKKLSPEARKAIAAQALKDVAAKRVFTPSQYMQMKDVPAKVRAEIDGHFKKHFQLDDTGAPVRGADYTRLDEVRTKQRDVTERMPNNKEAAKAYLEAGYGEQLRAMGIIIKDGDNENYNTDEAGRVFAGQRTAADYKDLNAAVPGMAGHPFGNGFHAQPMPMQSHMKSEPSSNDAMVDAIKEKLSELNGGSDAIVAQLKENREDAASQVKILEGILDVLEHRDFVENSGVQASATGSDKTGRWGKGVKNWFKRKDKAQQADKEEAKGLWNSVKLTGRGLGGLTGSAARGVGHVAGGLFGAMGHVNRGLYNLAKGITKTGWKAASGLVGLGEPLNDVYVKGGKMPIMLAKKMKLGEYTDALTGKVISKPSQIKGAVKDKDGNIILSVEEYAGGLYDTRGKRIVMGLGRAIGSSAGMLARLYGNTVLLPFKMARTGIKTALKLHRWHKDRMDIYVPGERMPRLLGVKLARGEYFDALSNKPLKSWKDLHGAVKDKDGNVILTAEEYADGVIDTQGKHIRSLARFTGAAVKSALTLPWMAAKTAVKTLASATKLVGQAAFGFLHHGISGILPQMNRKGHDFGGKETLNMLKLQLSATKGIFNILHQRLPKGDDKRAGSWEETFLKRSHAKELADAAKKGPAASMGGGMGGGGLMSWLKNKFGGGDKKQGNTLEDDASDVKNAYDDAKGVKGILGKAGRGLKSVWNAGKGLLRGGRAASAIGEAGEVAEGAGALGEAATVAGTAAEVGGAALGAGEAGAAVAGGVGLLGGLGAAASAVGLGALAVITSPVTLVAGAIAAVGIGAWYAYKWYDSKKPRPLRLVRLAQYGVDPKESNQMKKVLNLEEAFKDNISYGATGATLTAKGLNLQDLMKSFGVNASDAKSANAWVQWFSSRFKPVFLKHLSTLHGLDPKVKLADVDEDLAVEKRMDFLNGVKLDAAVYSQNANPFAPDSQIVVGSQPVDAAVKAAGIMIGDAIRKAGKDGGKKDGFMMSTLKTIGSILLAPITMGMSLLKGVTDALGLTKEDKKNDGAKATAKGVADKLALTNQGISKSVGTPIPMGAVLGTKPTAMQCIRFKAYGLIDLAQDKCKMLFALEQEIFPKITFSGKGQASFDGDASVFFNKFCGTFGLLATDVAMKKSWMDWFNGRFLPVALGFATAVRAVNANAKLDNVDAVLTPDQLVEVANNTVASKSTADFSNVSVWAVSTSPWPKYVLGADPKITDVNIDFLKTQVSKKTLDDSTGKKNTPTTDNGESKNADGKTATTPPATASAQDAKAAANVTVAKPPPQTIQNIRTNSKSDYDKQSAGAGQSAPVATGMSMPQFSGSLNVGGGSGGGGGGPSGPVGSVMAEPGNGPGGDVNAIPMPGPGKGWAAAQPTIEAAAKMAGVDVGLMATIANIESGFRPTVQAGAGSAAGYYQFISSTWGDMMKHYASKYGIDPKTSPLDPRANALMGAEFLKGNQKAMEKGLGRPVTDTEMYLAHFLGSGGALSLLSAPRDAAAADLFKPKVAQNNASIFLDKGRKRTVQEIIALMDVKVKGHAIAGVGNSSRSTMPTSKGATTTTANKAPSANATITGLPAGNGAAAAVQSGELATAKPATGGTTAGAKAASPFAGVTGGASTTVTPAVAAPQSAWKPAVSATPSASVDRAAPSSGGSDSSADDSIVVNRRIQAQQTAAAMDMQSQQSTEAGNKLSADTGSVLAQSLVVQQAMAKSLSDILKQMGGGGLQSGSSGGADTSSTPGTASSPAAKSGLGAGKSAPQAPVDVSRLFSGGAATGTADSGW
jgi:hypothetical protein